MSATVVGGLAIGFLPSVASATAPEPPAEQSTTAFCANVPAAYEPFTDVTGNKANIECAAAAGLTQGTSTPTLYNPGGVVSRAQMASFIARLIDKANELDVAGAPDLAALPAYDGTNEFTDNPDPAHVANINRLADANIVLGGPGGRPASQYGGGLPVQRDQMASFINRAQDYLGDGLVDGDGYSSSSDYFTDDNASVHEDNIQAIASRGIAIGDGTDTYAPNAGVTRDQMASFLVRHLADNFEAGLITAVPAPPGGANQTFTVTPSDSVDVEEGDTRQFTVDTGDATEVDILLFECGNVTAASGGQVTFAALADPDDDQADPGDTTGAALTVVNGIVTGDGDAVVPVNGNVTFTVEGTDAVCVTPVVFEDADDDDTLNLDADGAPTDDFGIGGATNFVPPEAAGGGFGATLVVSVDKAGDSFTTGDATYDYDANDTFSVDGVPSTLATFEAGLSSGDVIAGTYAPEPAASSDFDLTDLTPAPTTVTVADQDGDDVSVTFVENGADSYNVYRALSEDELTCDDLEEGDYALVGSATESPFADTTVVTPEEYCYAVAAVTDGQESALSDVTSATGFVATTAADTSAPTSTDARVTTSAGLAGQLDAGDVFKVAFSEPMNDPLTDTLVVRDADGTFATITCGAVAPATVCVLNSAVEVVGGVSYPIGQVMTATIAGTAPLQTSAGTVPGLQIPTTITDHSGVADVADNAWNIPGSADVVIDVEA